MNTPSTPAAHVAAILNERIAKLPILQALQITAVEIHGLVLLGHTVDKALHYTPEEAVAMFGITSEELKAHGLGLSLEPVETDAQAIRRCWPHSHMGESGNCTRDDCTPEKHWHAGDTYCLFPMDIFGAYCDETREHGSHRVAPATPAGQHRHPYSPVICMDPNCGDRQVTKTPATFREALLIEYVSVLEGALETIGEKDLIGPARYDVIRSALHNDLILKLKTYGLDLRALTAGIPHESPGNAAARAEFELHGLPEGFHDD